MNKEEAGKIKMQKRRGAATLEFVFAFIFLLIFFIVIISFQFITIQRMAGVISVWRIQRVSSLVNNEKLFIQTTPSNSNYNIINTIGFGDLVVMTLKSANITVLKDKEDNNPNKQDNQYKIVYHSPFLKTFEKYFYDKDIKNPYDKIYWVEPKSPPKYDEHGKGG